MKLLQTIGITIQWTLSLLFGWVIISILFILHILGGKQNK